MRFRSTAPLRLRGGVFSKLKLEALEARTLLSAGFWDGFASNPQHTAISTVASQPLETIRWQAPIDLAPFETAHYGTPMATAADTIIFPVRTSSSDTFRVEARSGIDGSLLWSQDSGFVMPPHAWLPEFPATLTPSGRLYFADANGVVDYRDNPDAPSGPTGSIQFYAGAPDSTVCIDTPITSDSHGNIYFGFRLNGTSPTFGFSDGLARIDASGHGSYVLARTASGDLLGIFVSENCAPALSHDESTVYFAVGAFTHGYLVGVDATTLTPRYSVLLHDPRNGNANTAGVVDNSTASPTIGPDGTVFFGVLGNPFNGSRGWLLHFSADLATEYAPGAFGWDDTAAIVPTSMVPSYTGTSSYLIFTKYNNYAGTCCDLADGTNKIAILDPYATQVESHPSSNGLLVMKEVMTMLGPTPDPDFRPQFPNAVREWCINTAAVDPFTDSVLCPSEDGHIYRWDLSTNTLSQSVSLTPSVSEPYVPTIIGPDGTTFTLNGGTLFAVGKFLSNISLQVSSTSLVFSQPVTLTATVTGTGPALTQTVSFYDGSILLGSNGVDSSGQASITISNLAGGLRSITAVYSGDANYIPRTSAATSVTVSPDTTSTGLTSAPNPSSGDPVTFTATITADAPGTGIPAGTVTFKTAKNVLAVVPLDSTGHASLTTSTLNSGSITVTAIYNNTDGNYITSGGSTVQQVNKIMTTTTLTSSLNPSESGSSVTLTATVSSSSTVNAGTVTFKDGRIVLAVVPVNSSGVAIFTTSSLSVGSHKIIAIYSGNSTLNDSGSNPVVQVVNPSGAALTSTGSLPGDTPNLTALAIAESSESLDLLTHELRTSTASSILADSTLGAHPKQPTSQSALDLWSLEQLFAAVQP